MQPDLLLLCLTLLSGFMPSSSCLAVASACVPTTDGFVRCARELIANPPTSETIELPILEPTAVPTRVAVPRPRPTATVIKPPVAAPSASPRSGATPYDALDADDAWRIAGPGQKIWYKLGDAKVPRVHMWFWLDAKGWDGIGFVVYAPDQMYSMSPSGPPKGAGTRNRNDPTHDLNWSGQAPAGGVWYALVHNANSVPVEYKFGSNLIVTGLRENCTGPYVEFLGPPVNHEVVWPGYCP